MRENKAKTYTRAPLPFSGNKANWRKTITELVTTHFNNHDYVFIDVFGGSGILSRFIKDALPHNRVIYNDKGYYISRIKHIPLLNQIRQDLAAITPTNSQEVRAYLKDLQYKHNKQTIASILPTLASWLLFSSSSSLCTDFDKLLTAKLYNRRIVKDIPACDDYLQGLEVTHLDAFELINQIKAIDTNFGINSNNIIFVLDPPYLNTSTKQYNDIAGLSLKEHLSILNLCKDYKYIYFNEKKSGIYDLFAQLNISYQALEKSRCLAGNQSFKVTRTEVCFWSNASY